MVVSGGVTCDSTLELFTAEQIGLDVIMISDSDGSRYTRTITTYTDIDRVEISSPIPDGTYTMYIEGGAGAHCLLVDCLHCSFGDGATYGANDNDLTPPRPQFPRAAPNGSNQGGTGVGGNPTDGGGPLCVEINEPVITLYGNGRLQKRIGDITVGEVVESGNMQPNVVATVPRRSWCLDIWELETENGCTVRASPSHPVFRNRLDKSGTPIEMVTTRMKVLTYIDGALEQSRVIKVGPTGKGGNVVMLSCTPGPSFIAGNAVSGQGGIVCHNSKPPIDPPVVS